MKITNAMVQRAGEVIGHTEDPDLVRLMLHAAFYQESDPKYEPYSVEGLHRQETWSRAVGMVVQMLPIKQSETSIEEFIVAWANCLFRVLMVGPDA